MTALADAAERERLGNRVECSLADRDADHADQMRAKRRDPEAGGGVMIGAAKPVIVGGSGRHTRNRA